jgi:hypothetical protein
MNWKTETWTAIATVVAFAALVQPWLTAAWRRLFRSGRVDIYETESIEVGYSGLGATIALTGTLRARDRDAFIHSANLDIVDLKNMSKRSLQWGFFRTPKTVIGIALDRSAEVALDRAFSFMVSTASPYRYNIACLNPAFFQEVHPVLQTFIQSWRQQISSTPLPDAVLDPSLQPKLMRAIQEAYQRFSTTPEYNDAFRAVDQLYVGSPAHTN